MTASPAKKYPKNNKRPKTSHLYITWLIKNKHADSNLSQKYQLELLGIPIMVHGLDYHYRNFRRLEKKAELLLSIFFQNIEKKGSSQYPRQLEILQTKAFHEVGAYLNILGRIEKAMTSWWIKKYINSEDIAKYIPSLLAIIPFRNKCFAHRSFDYPRGIEEEIVKQSNPKKQNPVSEYHIETHLLLGLETRWREKYLSYEIQVHEKDRHNLLIKHFNKSQINEIEHFTKNNNSILLRFSPSQHHLVLLNEIVIFFEKLFQQI